MFFKYLGIIKTTLITLAILMLSLGILPTGLFAQSPAKNLTAENKFNSQGEILFNPFFREAYFKNEEETVTIINILKEISGATKPRGLDGTKTKEVQEVKLNLDDTELAIILRNNPMLNAAFKKDARQVKYYIAKVLAISKTN